MPKQNPQVAEAKRLLAENPELASRFLLLAEPPPKQTCLRPLDVYEACKHLLLGFESERLVVVCVNRRHVVIAAETLTIGSDAFTIVDPRQIYRWALKQKAPAAAIFLAHNHPSEDATPSQQDIDVTRRIAAAGRVLGMPLLDHIIVGGGSWSSLSENGHVPTWGEESTGWTS